MLILIVDVGGSVAFVVGVMVGVGCLLFFVVLLLLFFLLPLPADLRLACAARLLPREDAMESLVEEGEEERTSISSMSEMTAGAAISLARGLAADWGSEVFGLLCILLDEPVVDRRNVKSLPSDDMMKNRKAPCRW